MIINYSDGSFMLSWEKARAWYNPDGSIKDAEHKFQYKGRPAARAVKVNGPAWKYLERQGLKEMELRRMFPCRATKNKSD